MRTLILATVLAASTVAAQKAPAKPFEAEYMSGREDMPKKKRGVLYLEDSVVVFTSERGDSVFSIPLREIKEVSNQADIRDASLGSKMLFGGLAGSRKQDFLSVTWETTTGVEVIVWKVKQNTGAGLAAKIRFAVKQVTGSEPGGGSQPTNPKPPA